MTHAGGGDRVVRQIIRVDRISGGVGYRDATGAKIEIVVEMDGYTGTRGLGAVEKAAILVAIMITRVRISEPELGFPDRAVVTIGEGRRVRRAGFLAHAAVVKSNLTGSRRAVRE